MVKKIIIAAAVAALGLSQVSMAQTNLQIFHDFGADRNYATATLEGFYGDKWGDTFFFSDFYFRPADAKLGTLAGGATNGVYFEIERAINFWQGTALKDFSLHVEYDGSTWGSSMACFGAKYSFHNADFSNLFNVAIMYDAMFGQQAQVPVKLSGVWGFQNIFGLTGLTFKGFFDVWGLDDHVTFLSEPQLWYNLGAFFDNHLDIGSEIELSYNFAGHQGFMVNPCLGIKWTF